MAISDPHQEAASPATVVRWTRKDIFLSALAIILTITISTVGIFYRDKLLDIGGIGGYSLLGILIVSFAAGSLLSFTAVPVPYWLLVFTLPTILAPQWGILAPVSVGFISALGATSGHMPTFLLGYGGSTLSHRMMAKFDSRFHSRAIKWAQKHGAWASFLISAIFNPIHLPMTIAMGTLRFPPLKFFFFSFLGNSVKGLFLAFAGYFGLNSLLRIIGI